MNNYVVDNQDSHRKVGDVLEERGDKEGQYVIIIKVPSKTSEFFLLQRLSDGRRFWVGALTLFDSYKHTPLTELSKALVDAQHQFYIALDAGEQAVSGITKALDKVRELHQTHTTAISQILLTEIAGDKDNA